MTFSVDPNATGSVKISEQEDDMFPDADSLRENQRGLTYSWTGTIIQVSRLRTKAP